MLHHPNRRTGATTRAALSLATHLTTPGAGRALAVSATYETMRDLLARVGEVMSGLGLLRESRYDMTRGELTFDATGNVVKFATAEQLGRQRGQRFAQVTVDGEVTAEERMLLATMEAPRRALNLQAEAAGLEHAFSRALEWTAQGLAQAATKSSDVATKAYADAQAPATLGYKAGATTLDAGYFYAPYIPALSLPEGLKPARKKRVLSSR